MRFLFKTDHDPDIRLFRFGGGREMWAMLAGYAALLVVLNAAGVTLPQAGWAALGAAAAAVHVALVWRQGAEALWYGLLGVAALTAPFVLGAYFVSQLTFVYIYAIAGVGLVILLGLAGQISLGHAAFFACGAYTAAILTAQGFDVLVTIPAALALSAVLGVIIGLPALRMTGIYLGFATYAFAFIVEEILARWDSLTNGTLGMPVGAAALGYGDLRLVFESEFELYYLALALAVAALAAGLNLQRSPTGRAWMAIRDSETAAASMGVNLAVYKTAAFAVSAALAGVAGALYAHAITFISPEQFTILLSINLLVMMIVGGLGSMHGAVFGAIFLVMMPQAIGSLKSAMPDPAALGPVLGFFAGLPAQPGFEAGVYGLIIILFIVFEPMGLHGWWMKAKTYFRLFPLYKKGMFKRQKAYMASERNR